MKPDITQQTENVLKCYCNSITEIGALHNYLNLKLNDVKYLDKTRNNFDSLGMSFSNIFHIL